MSLPPHECGGCRHCNLSRTQPETRAKWCDQFSQFVVPIGLTDCPVWERRSCGSCVVFNPHPSYAQGSCSIHGPVGQDSPPCRHYFSKRQLVEPPYGRAKRA